MKLLVFVLILISWNALGQGKAHFYLELSENARAHNADKINKKDYLKIQSNNLEADSIFGKFKVYKFEKAFPTAKTPRLQRTYLIDCDDIKLMHDLRKADPVTYIYASEIMEPVLCYDPNDYGGSPGSAMTSQTNLDLIRAKEAWDITMGDPNVIIGITDTYFELTHEDLAGQIIQVRGSNNDPNSSIAYHGGATSGVVAAATNNGKGIAAIASNCKMIVSSSWGSDNELLVLSQLGARVLNASWLNGCSFSSTTQLVYDEIKSNGTIMVAAAGNKAAHCGSLTSYAYPASYNNVISVTAVGSTHPIGHPDSLGWNDVHENLPGDPLTAYHHHDKIDICAPGFDIPTLNLNNGYFRVNGTSSSSPMVAGVCALIISANTCLTPDETEAILKSTAVNIDNITQNLPYAGLLGAGRVDAFEAVKAASILGTLTLQNLTIPGTQEYEAPYSVKAIGNITIQNGANVTFEAKNRVEIQGPFNVELGAQFNINTGNVTIVCP